MKSALKNVLILKYVNIFQIMDRNNLDKSFQSIKIWIFSQFFE